MICIKKKNPVFWWQKGIFPHSNLNSLTKYTKPNTHPSTVKLGYKKSLDFFKHWTHPLYLHPPSRSRSLSVYSMCGKPSISPLPYPSVCTVLSMGMMSWLGIPTGGPFFAHKNPYFPQLTAHGLPAFQLILHRPLLSPFPCLGKSHSRSGTSPLHGI